MPYDEALAERIRDVLADVDGVSEKKMFGGICFLVNGNMACGVTHEDLMIRLGNEAAAAALEEEFVRPMDFTGKPLKSMVYVELEGVRKRQDLRRWVTRGAEFAASLPPK